MKIVFSLFTALLFSFYGNAQDCTLDIGGKNSDILTKVFQLNADQISKMEAFRAELDIKTKGLEDEIQKLFDNHPQSTPDDLTILSEKYSILQNNIVNASKATDKMLLSTFNKKQYKRYLELCHEAIRKPIKVIPIPMKDAVVDPE